MGLMKDGQEPREGVHGIEMRFLIAQDNRPSRGQLDTQAEIREAIFDVAQAINEDVEDGREKSLALTHLEESLMWAGKAIFR